ncbi:hypothetical protein HanPI659440_Chr05g0209561 [Helianthus annuus]|nr:hypothetical protein HanPI659440_Chr05g0209561 [Helianthus annuus]
MIGAVRGSTGVDSCVRYASSYFSHSLDLRRRHLQHRGRSRHQNHTGAKRHRCLDNRFVLLDSQSLLVR